MPVHGFVAREGCLVKLIRIPITAIIVGVLAASLTAGSCSKLTK